MIFARKGEEIRDDFGTLIATFTRDVDVTEVMALTALRFEGDMPMADWRSSQREHLRIPAFKSVRAA